jgi:hypothetical protein
MSTYNQFVKEQMAKMRDDPRPAKDKMKIIGKLWTSKKGKKGNSVKGNSVKGGYIPHFRIPPVDKMYSQVTFLPHTPSAPGMGKKKGSGFGLLW